MLPEDAPADQVREIAAEIQSIYKEIAELEYRTEDIRNYLAEYDRPLAILDLAARVDLSGDDYRQGPIRTDDVETEDGTVYRVVMKRSHHLAFDDERVRAFVHLLLTAQNRRLTR